MHRLSQRSCCERRAPTWIDRVCNRKSVSGFFAIWNTQIWNLHQPKGVPSSHFHQPKSLGWWKVRGGQIKKNAKFRWFKWPKTCYTLSITYSINPRGCPPLTAISLGQAVHYHTKLHTHNETQWPTAARWCHFALRDVSCRQSWHLLTPSHPWVPPEWPPCQKAHCENFII